MSHASDSKRLAAQLRREGFTVDVAGSGHWEVRTADGERVATFARTPSDNRWKQNAVADIRRWKRSKGIPLERALLQPLVHQETHAVESSGRRASILEYARCSFQ